MQTRKRSTRMLAALLLALALWGTAVNQRAQQLATPAPLQVADPGGSSGGNGG